MKINDIAQIHWRKRSDSAPIDKWFGVQACLESEDENSLEIGGRSYFDDDQSMERSQEYAPPTITSDYILKVVNQAYDNCYKVEDIIDSLKDLDRLDLATLKLIERGLVLIWQNLNSDLGSYLDESVNSLLKGKFSPEEIKTIKDIYYRVKGLDYQKELGDIRSVNKSLPELNKDEKEFLELVSKHIYLDNYTADLDNKLQSNLNRLVEVYGLDLQDLVWYSFEDLENLVKKKKILNKDGIEERKHYRVMVKIGGEIGFFYGRENFDRIKSFLGNDKPETIDDRVRGQTACPGKAVGKVKKVLGIKDMDKVNNGDILVSTMTRPDLLVAIKKAGGIVTDLGGITSHAAIISRELGIPCIVGTKNATKILKDGMRVEVDADQGIVRKIE